jgi:hypothetical protein
MTKTFLIILMIFMPIEVYADDITEASVISIMLDRSYGMKAYVQLSEKKLTRTTECHDNVKWEYVLDISDALGEKIYSNLLVLYSTHKRANFYGTGDCLHEGIEELRRVEILN